MSKTLSLFLLLLPVLTLAHSHGDPVSARSRHSRRGSLQKRAQGTFYEAGLGACGGFNSDSDFIVALNKEQFDQGGWCYKHITIDYNGKSAQAQIVDRCEGCGFGNIDLTPGLFSFLSGAPLSDILRIGTIQLDWHVGGGSDNPPPPTTTTTHKTTDTASDTPKSTKTQTSETKSHSSTSSSSTHSSTASSSTKSATSTTSSTVPTYTPAPLTVHNIADLKGLMVGMGQLVLSARS